MNLLIIMTGGDGFPMGGAYTNRILAIAKGLLRNGAEVTLLIMYPGKTNEASIEGDFDGFHYRFTAGTLQPTGFLAKKLIGIRGILSGCWFIWKHARHKKYDAVLTFTSSLSINFSLFILTRFIGSVLIREKNEFPILILHKGFDRLNVFNRLYLNYAYRIFDGFLFISDALKDFFIGKIRKDALVDTLPIVVDNDRFQSYSEDLPDKMITYCGYLFGDKDGVLILIQSFALLAKKYFEFQLYIIGGTNHPVEFPAMQNFVRLLGIEKQVVFTGYVHRDAMPQYLERSAMLVLARPDNIQAKAGFPTKLAEYFATGRPVLVTAVGDIPKYVHDGINGYLAIPGNVEDFARKMDLILTDYDTAKRIGLEGRKLTEEVFSNLFQGKRILEFIGKVKSRRK